MRRALIALVLAASSTAQAHAAPGWTEPVTIDPGGTFPGATIAGTPDGRVFLVHRPGSTIAVRVRPPGGTLGSEVATQPMTGFGAEWTLGAGGDVLVWWRDFEQHLHATYLASGSAQFTEPVQVTSQEAGDVGGAVSPDGTAYLLWSGTTADDHDAVRLKSMPPGGTWSTVSTVEFTPDDPDAGEYHRYESPVITCEDGGDCLAGWDRVLVEPNGMNPDTVTDNLYVTDRVSAGAGWTEPHRVGAAGGTGQGAFGLRLQRSPSGHALATWSRTSFGVSAFYSVVRPPGGSWPDAIDATSPIGVYTWGAEAALAADGTAIAVGGVETPNGDRIRVTERAPGATGWSEPAYLSADGDPAHHPHVSGGDAGNAAVVWARPSGLRAAVGTHRTGGSWADPADIAPTEQSSNPFIRLAGDADGNAAVLVPTSIPDHAIRLAALDRAGPELSGLAIPAVATAGTATSFAVDAVDAWSSFTVAWAFGDGGSATGDAVQHAFAQAGTFDPRVTATDALGNATTATGSTVVSSVSPQPTPTPGATPDPPPGVSRLRATARRITVTLSEPARVRVRIHRCARGRGCRRPRRVGTFTRDVEGGTVRLRVPRAIRRKLRPGRHRATLVATDAAGTRSLPVRVRFRVR